MLTDPEVMTSARLAAAALSPTARQEELAENQIIVVVTNPATMITHSTLVLKAALRETRPLGQLPFRGMGQYLTGHYVEFKQTTTKYMTASASRNSCRAAAYQAQAWGKTRSLNSLERGSRPQL